MCAYVRVCAPACVLECVCVCVCVYTSAYVYVFDQELGTAEMRGEGERTTGYLRNIKTVREFKSPGEGQRVKRTILRLIWDRFSIMQEYECCEVRRGKVNMRASLFLG